MTDAELLQVSDEFREGILGHFRYGGDSTGMCFAVSAALGGLLSTMGLECRLVQRDFGFTNHVWLELPDGRMLDATADQFNNRLRRHKLPKVHLGAMPKAYRRWLRAQPQPGNGGQ